MHNRKGTNINYVLVEMVSKEAVEKGHTQALNSLKRGLLRGIKIDKSEAAQSTNTYISLDTRKNPSWNERPEDITLCNIEDWNILSIETSDGITVEVSFYMSNDPDQEEAFNYVNKLIETLIKDDRCTEKNKNIIDTKTYCNIPSDWDKCGSGINSTKSRPPVSTSAGANDYYSKRSYGPAKTDSTYSANTTVERKPTFIKRKTKKPSDEDILKMKKMVKQITNGKYEQPPFKTLQVDKVKKTVGWPRKKAKAAVKTVAKTNDTKLPGPLLFSRSTLEHKKTETDLTKDEEKWGMLGAGYL